MSKHGLVGVLERYDELQESGGGATPSWFEAREWLITAIEQANLASQFEDMLRADKEPEPGSFDEGYQAACKLIESLVRMRYKEQHDAGISDEIITNDALSLWASLRAERDHLARAFREALLSDECVKAVAETPVTLIGDGDTFYETACRATLTAAADHVFGPAEQS